jgi:hypothetical protein
MSSFWNWLVSLFGKAPVVIGELQPVVTEGEALVADLTKVVNDLKTNNLVSVVVDAQAVLADAKQFVADVEVIVAQLQAAKQ